MKINHGMTPQKLLPALNRFLELSGRKILDLDRKPNPAHSTPVAALAVDALVEGVREGGYLIEPNEFPSFVDRMHRHFDLPEREREAQRAEARDYLRREYYREKTSARYLDLLEGRA